jgi:hypothetical protein
MVQAHLEAEWLAGDALESRAVSYAISELVPRHLKRVRDRREDLIDKTLAAVQERLTKEINYWDRRTVELREQERAGRSNARINSARAQQRADELSARLRKRKAELELERQISAAPPVVIGGAVIVPAGLLYQDIAADRIDRRITEEIGMRAVMQAEIALGNDPQDVSDREPYDILSHDREGKQRFIEVKARLAGNDGVELTCNELLTALNSPEQYVVAIVQVEPDGAHHPPRYVFDFAAKFDVKNIPFGSIGMSFSLQTLLGKSEPPR